mgnify:CR=1 FL=1
MLSRCVGFVKKQAVWVVAIFIALGAGSYAVASSGALVAQRDDDTGAQKAALEELAERVSAARSVV